MLRGESILRPNRKEDGKPDGGELLPLPSDDKLRKLFDDTVRDAYAGMPSARSDHYQAARAIYAALSVDAGDRDTSLLDMDRWKQAIDMATGGIVKYNGRNVPLPYGQDMGQFREGLAHRLDDLAEGGRLDERWTRSDLLDLPLEAAGDGKYVFKVGDSLLVDKAGKVVMVDFGMFVPSGHALRGATPAELAQAAKPVTGRALKVEKK